PFFPLSLGASAALRFRVGTEVPVPRRCATRRRAAAGIKGARTAERPGRARREAAGARAGKAARTRTARSTIFSRAGFADRQRPPVEHLSVELLDRLLGMRAIEKLDERKAARAPGLPIDRQDDLRRRRDAAKVRTQVGFGRGVVEITNEQTDGQSTLSYLGRSRAGKDRKSVV